MPLIPIQELCYKRSHIFRETLKYLRVSTNDRYGQRRFQAREE